MHKSLSKTDSQTPKQKGFPYLKIEWIDAQSDITWEDSIDKIQKWADTDCVINETGWLICESDRYIVLCNQIGEDGEFGNRTKIPKNWIKGKKKVLAKLVKSERKRKRTTN